MTMFMLRSSMVLLSLVLLGACATEEDHVQCTEDCVRVTTDCQTPALAAGVYTLVYGEGSVELTVPVAMATCADESM